MGQLSPIPTNDDSSRIADLEAAVKFLQTATTPNIGIGDWRFKSGLGGADSGSIAGGTLVIVDAYYAVANGATVNKADYPALSALYALDSYPYGSTSTTFNLPDARGRDIKSIDGTNFTALGAHGGAVSGIPTLPAHAHTLGAASVGGAPGVGTLAVSPASHSHSASSSNFVESAFSYSVSSGSQGAIHGQTDAASTASTSLSITGAPSVGTLDVTGSTDSAGSGGAMSTVDPYIVAVLPLIRIR
jgi:microcystin-dependent protein